MNTEKKTTKEKAKTYFDKEIKKIQPFNKHLVNEIRLKSDLGKHFCCKAYLAGASETEKVLQAIDNIIADSDLSTMEVLSKICALIQHSKE